MRPLYGRLEESREPYRAAIIGCGRVAGGFDDDPLRKTIWTHAGAYAAHPSTELVAVADIDPDAAEAFAHRWGATGRYRDARELLAREQVDILSICTWADSHKEIVSQAVVAGVKAIWCEKPIARTLAEADGMLRDCQGLVLAVNHIRRWDACYRKAKAVLEEKAIGRVQGVTCAYSGGVSNMGVHLFDALMYLLGPVRGVWVSPIHGESTEDPAPSGSITFHSGVVAHIVGCDRRSYQIFEIDILGTEGRLRIESNGYLATLWGVGASDQDSDDRTLEFPRILHDDDEGARMVDALSDILQCVEYGGQPSCSGSDGKAALEVTTAFLKGLTSGRKVSLPLRGKDLHREVPFREVVFKRAEELVPLLR